MIESSSKSICFLSLKHPPFDKRVFRKEARSLSNAGYGVTHIAPGSANQLKNVNGVQIRTYKVSSNKIIERVFNLPRLFFLALDVETDCYHCNEPDSWIVGLLLKLFTKRKVVFDVHEHYPSRVAENYFPPYLHVAISKVVRFLFRFLSRITDGIVFAKKSVADDFPEDINSAFVYNYTVVKELEEVEPVHRKSNENSITAIHMGLISKKRGWPQLISAVKQLEELDVKIHIVGAFNDNSRQEFISSIDRYGISDMFIFESWMSFKDAFQRVTLADIGLILFQPGIKNHEYALPHKMFDYMLAGLPVIIPRFAVELRPIIVNEKCGILVDTSNPDEIATAIKELCENEQKRKAMGERGRQAVLKKFNWENEEEKLLKFYADLLQEGV